MDSIVKWDTAIRLIRKEISNTPSRLSSPSLQLHALQFLRVSRREHGGSDLSVTTRGNFGPIGVPLTLFGHHLEDYNHRVCIITCNVLLLLVVVKVVLGYFAKN